MAYQQFHQQRIDAGLCKDCGAERGADGTTIFCRPCADLHSQKAIDRTEARRREWKDMPGVCNRCGAPAPDPAYKSCGKCREKRRALWERNAERNRKKREANGHCALCLRPALSPSRYCHDHLMYNCTKHSGIPRADWGPLWAKLEAQGFQCYYTGKTLTPGVNLSIDHRVPHSRGGSKTDLDNLVWCDRDINAFKNDLTEDEFIAQCRVIVSRFPR